MNKKNKKIVTITGIALGVLIAIPYGTYTILGNVKEYEKEQDGIESGVPEWPIEGTEEAAQEVKEQTQKIGGTEETTGLDENSTEGEVISVMHKMTHQKVRSEDKWGAIRMTSENMEKVRDVIEANNNNYKNGDSLLRIINKWLNGNFTTIVQDHNYFWKLQGGTIGKAYGMMNAEEEAKFIENNFK